ncbi:hypothetical protein H5410_014711, partial [Solanum commersonii]
MNEPRRSVRLRCVNSDKYVVIGMMGVSNSFNFCATWTSACCRLHIDQSHACGVASFNKSRAADDEASPFGVGRLILDSALRLWRRRLSHIPRLDASRPCLMPRAIGNADVSQLMRAPAVMSASLGDLCATFGGVVCPHMQVGSRRMAVAPRPSRAPAVVSYRPWPMSPIALADGACRWPMKFARCAHARLKACALANVTADGRREPLSVMPVDRVFHGDASQAFACRWRQCRLLDRCGSGRREPWFFLTLAARLRLPRPSWPTLSSCFGCADSNLDEYASFDPNMHATDDVGKPRLTSAHGYEQATKDAARPRHVQSWLTDVCRPRTIVATDDEVIPRLTLADRCVRAMDDAGKPRPISADRCVQATNYVARPCPTARLTLSDHCVLATADSGSPCPTSADHCVQAKGDVGRPRRTSADTAVCRPREIWAGHTRRWLTNVCRPRVMRAGIGCCCLPLADAAYQMSTCHIRFIQALVDAAYHWPTLMSHSQYAHAMTDECRPWLLPPIVSRRRLLHAHIPPADAYHWPSLLARCTHAISDVSRPWLMPPAPIAPPTDDASRSWLMVHVVGRRHLPDAHTLAARALLLSEIGLPKH